MTAAAPCKNFSRAQPKEIASRRVSCVMAKQSSQKHVPAKAGMVFPILGKNAAKTKESGTSVQMEATAGVW